jgi:hypothetical protein
MTHHPDDHQPPEDAAGDLGEGRPKLDEDAAWREIIEHYGERPEMGEDVPPVAPPETYRVVEPVETNVFDRSFLDSLNTEATWDDEGHFVPPEPPPLPRLETPRKLAWIGFFGAPAAMVLGVVFHQLFGWYFPTWAGPVLIAAFLGGFGYLVATMPRHRYDDGSGDDGAVV